MHRAGRVVREVLELVRSKVKPGATTLDLEKAAAARLNELGVKAGELAILLRVEEGALDVVGASEPRAGLRRLDAYLERILLDKLCGMGLALEARAAEELDGGIGAHDLLAEQ